MREGGVRRVAVDPTRGWRKNGCVGTITTDIGIVPGAKVQQADECLDAAAVPSPRTYETKRKFTRRYDEGLIAEVELVRVGAPESWER